MSRTESPLTTRGVELIRAGQGLRATAELLGLDKATLVRACQRAVPPVVIPPGKTARKKKDLTHYSHVLHFWHSGFLV